MVYNNIPTFSALTLWITSRHTATSFNTSDRGFPLHFPALILFCLLHWATLSLLSTTCWVSSSATKKMHIYIYHHSSTKILTLQSHTRAQWTNREDPFSRTLHVQHPECARQPRKMGAAELKNSRVLQIWLWRRPKYRQCSFVMVNMPRQGNKSLLRCEGLRYRSRAAQQGCGDCQRGISSGQTNVVFWVFFILVQVKRTDFCHQILIITFLKATQSVSCIRIIELSEYSCLKEIKKKQKDILFQLTGQTGSQTERTFSQQLKTGSKAPQLKSI